MRSLLVSITLIVLSCNSSGDYLEVLGDTEKEEISGLEYLTGKDTLWALEDSGNKDRLYMLDMKGKITREIKLSGFKNNDWEDITEDKEGNLYIGDFGNNSNTRKDLAIYRVSHDNLKDDSAPAEYTVNFSYPEQENFPPKKSSYLYDAEGFFEYNGNFYLFTKNRSAKYNGSFRVYKVPNKPGKHMAQLVARLNSCSNYRKCAIAGADISPNGKTVALISSQKLWLFENFDGTFKQQDLKEYDLGHFSQKEGITFKDNSTLLIADEKDGKTGGKLYQLKLADLQPKHKGN